MTKRLLRARVWQRVKHCIPPEPPRPKGGRPPVSDRACLTGILYVLKKGIPWEDLPQEMGCGSGMTCWRRLQKWQAAGVWQKMLRILREEAVYDTAGVVRRQLGQFSGRQVSTQAGHRQSTRKKASRSV